MENGIEFVSYKKVIIFGISGSGKSTLTSSIQKGTFDTQITTTENGKF